MKRILSIVVIISGVFMTNQAIGQQLVHQFKNPFFGGNTFNYQVMLSSAQAQDLYSDPTTEGFDVFGRSLNPLDDFVSNLNRQILNQLSRALVGDVFGREGGLEDGVYEIGDYQIEVTTSGAGVNISIFDLSTGSETLVTIPTID